MQIERQTLLSALLDAVAISFGVDSDLHAANDDSKAVDTAASLWQIFLCNFA
jgi:hypothetical protein